jgi:hypothetical protein
MRFGLVEPTDYAGDFGNPGWWFINRGTATLLRAAFPGVDLVSLPMRRPWCGEELQQARACDALMLVGNPRYDAYSSDGGWLYAGLLDQMAEAGRPMFDLWAGSGAPYFQGVDQDARTLLGLPRNAALVERLRGFAGVIARDDRTQRVNELAGLRSIPLPCSSWWSVADQEPARDRACRTVLASEGIGDAPRVAELSAKGWRVVVSRPDDVAWCASFGVRARLLRSPLEHLRCYAESRQLISYRLHAGIPAAALGCEVAVVGVDTRMQACDAFGIPWSTVGKPVPTPATAVPPPSIVPHLQEFIRVH